MKTGKPIGLRMLYTVFTHVAKRAGITKRCYPYLLRHCKGTEVYLKYPPAVAMKIMGHDDAKTGLVYTHLAEEDVLEALQKENGETPELPLAAKDTDKCENCGYSNAFGSIQCNKCKAPLGAAGAIKFEHDKEDEMKLLKELKELLVDPQIVSALKALKQPELVDVVKSTLKGQQTR